MAAPAEPRSIEVMVDSFRLRTGRRMPSLGMGTWQMGEDRSRRAQEIAALRLGLELGMTMIDTAEMYGDGAAEELVGEAIATRRDEVYLVSKVLPQHATRHGTIDACQESLKRLRTDHLDLYLLHWRSSVPLEETLDGFRALQDAGKIVDFGISNFGLEDMQRAITAAGGSGVVTDQVLYNLRHRGIEVDLLPWCRDQNVAIMAYSPLESSPEDQRRLLGNSVLAGVAARHQATPAQIAIAWLLHQGVAVIPKAATADHVRQNRAAHDLVLTSRDLGELDRAFPPPARRIGLEVR